MRRIKRPVGYALSGLFLGELVAIYAETARMQGMLGALFFCTILYCLRGGHGGGKRAAALLGAAFFLTFFIWGYCRTEKLEETGVYLKERYGEGQSVVIKGNVYAVTKKQYSIACYVEKARIYKTDETGIPVGSAYLCDRLWLVLPISDQDSISDKSAEVFCGDGIIAQASYTPWREQRNEGEFDEERYYTSLGIQGKFKVTQFISVRGHGIKARIVYRLAKIREEGKRRIGSLADPLYAGIYQGILLGEKGELDGEVVELYQMSGISHILSISGLHISLLGMVIYKLVRRKKGLLCSTIAAASVMGLYTLMVGSGFSTRRAFVMFVLSILAELLGRSYDLLSALYLAMILLLLENPFCIYHAGLQLSFAAVAGIGLLYPAVEQYCRLQNRIARALAASLCIDAFTRPLVIHSYHLLPMYGVFVNLIVVALMGVMVAFGVAGLLVSYVWWNAGRLCILLGSKILWLYEWLSKEVLKLPRAVKVVGEMGLFRTVVYYLFLLAMIRVMEKRCRKECIRESTVRRRNVGKNVNGENDSGENIRGSNVNDQNNSGKAVTDRKVIKKFFIGKDKNDGEKTATEWFVYVRRGVAVFTGFLLFVLATEQKMTGMTVKMLDVGQGDSIFIACGKTTILVDAGSSSKREIEKYTIFPFLKSNGVQRLDYLIITHSDSDHISGAAALMRERIQQKSFVKVLVLQDIGEAVKDEAYHQLEEEAKKNGVSVLYLSKGMVLANDKMTLECLWPVKGEETGDKNTLSIVFLLTDRGKGSKRFSMLFTGDLTGEGEIRMMRENAPLSETKVLKTGHHGSKASSGEAFLSVLKPALALISCSENNRYGHPSQETLERLQQVGSDPYITAKCGQITLRCKQGKITVETFLKGDREEE